MANEPLDPCPWCGEHPRRGILRGRGCLHAGCETSDCLVQPEITVRVDGDDVGAVIRLVTAWNKRKGEHHDPD